MKNTKLCIAFVLAMLGAVLALGGCSAAGGTAGSAANDASGDSQQTAAAFSGDMVISAEEARAKIGSDDTVFVDCTGNAIAGTVKGAVALVWQDLSTCSAEYGEPGDENWGKIPEAADLASRLGSFGLDKSKEIICLGHTSTGWGDDGRVAWTLRAAGYDNVKIVDGGIDALTAAGAETQLGGSSPVACEVSVDSIDMTHVMETDELLASLDDCKVVDTRALEEYEGATFYGEKKGGHIPGAIHIEYLDLFKDDGTLKPNEEIVKMFEDAGVSKTDKVVAYCTGGIRSAYVQMVLEMCGFENTMNYDQSFWRWCVVGEVEEGADKEA